MSTEMIAPLSRAEAADACIRALDAGFFAALCEPVRIKLVRTLVLKGRSDIGTLAEDFSQDRSVISRHVQVMERAGLVVCTKVGRRQYVELNGPLIVQRLASMLDLFREIVPICCPADACCEPAVEKARA